MRQLETRNLKLTDSLELFVKLEHPSLKHFDDMKRGEIIEIYLEQDGERVCDLESDTFEYSHLMEKIINECIDNGDYEIEEIRG